MWRRKAPSHKKIVFLRSQILKKNDEKENVVKGAYYDSKTMDKPKEFEFTGNFDKIIPNILDFVTKKLF